MRGEARQAMAARRRDGQRTRFADAFAGPSPARRMNNRGMLLISIFHGHRVGTYGFLAGDSF